MQLKPLLTLPVSSYNMPMELKENVLKNEDNLVNVIVMILLGQTVLFQPLIV
jgi:hypothetical protein